MCEVGTHIIPLVHQISFSNVDLILFHHCLSMILINCWSWRIYIKLIIYINTLSTFHYSLTIKSKIKMESLHILFAIIFICLSASFCFGLFTWQFFRSTNHAITVYANYYSSFETRLKKIEYNLHTLNSLFTPSNNTNSGN